LVINGSQDRLFALDGVKAAFAKIARCYSSGLFSGWLPLPVFRFSVRRPKIRSRSCFMHRFLLLKWLMGDGH
jgi:hypothetical protein